MKLAKSLVGNMKLIFNNQFSFTKTEEVEDNLQLISAVQLEPSNLSIDQFWGHPASAPLWTMSRITQVDTRSNIWDTWWTKKVNSTFKNTPKKRLANYLTAIDQYNGLVTQFFGQLAFNPTGWSIEMVVANLTRMGDYLRLAGFEHLPLVEEYYKVATEIARATPVVESIYQKVKHLWPAANIPLTLHYGKTKFNAVKLDTYESDEYFKVTAPMKNYRFNPDEEWACNTDDDEAEGNKENELAEISTPKKAPVKKMAKRNLYIEKLGDEIDSYPSSSNRPLLNRLMQNMN